MRTILEMRSTFRKLTNKSFVDYIGWIDGFPFRHSIAEINLQRKNGMFTLNLYLTFASNEKPIRWHYVTTYVCQGCLLFQGQRSCMCVVFSFFEIWIEKIAR